MESLTELFNQLRELLNPKNIIDFMTTKGLMFTYAGLVFIIFARFVPIVRTFAPIVAGAAQMPYRRFVIYNVVGGFAWVFSMILAGYFLGTVVEKALGVKLEDHIEWVVIIVVLLSLLPPVIEYLKARREKKRLQRAGEAGG